MKIDDYCDTQTVALVGRKALVDRVCVLRFSIVCASMSWLAVARGSSRHWIRRGEMQSGSPASFGG